MLLVFGARSKAERWERWERSSVPLKMRVAIRDIAYR